MKTNIFYIFLATIFSGIFSYLYFFNVSRNLFAQDDILKIFGLDMCHSFGQILSPYLGFLISPIAIIFYFLLLTVYLFFRYKKSEIENKNEKSFVLFLCIYTLVCFLVFYSLLSFIGMNMAGVTCTPDVPTSARVY